jgi:hypothetical protein
MVRYVFRKGKRLATPSMGEIFKPKAHGAKQGEFKIAVAVRHGEQLLLTMTVRRDHKGGVYVIYPRQEGNPHASYHANGTYHHKSDNHAMMSEKRQPLTDAFKGCEHVGMFGGHGPKTIGAICNPANFSDVIEIEPGILGPRDGYVAVDLSSLVASQWTCSTRLPRSGFSRTRSRGLWSGLGRRRPSDEPRAAFWRIIQFRRKKTRLHSRTGGRLSERSHSIGG